MCPSPGDPPLTVPRAFSIQYSDTSASVDDRRMIRSMISNGRGSVPAEIDDVSSANAALPAMVAAMVSTALPLPVGFV